MSWNNNTADQLCCSPAYVVRREGNVLTRVCLSVSVHRGVPTLGRGYLSWMGVPTLDGEYLPWRGWGGGYLPRTEVSTLDSVATLDGGGGTYLGQGVPTMERGYLPWTGGTYLEWQGRVLTLNGEGYLPWMGGTYLGQGAYLGWGYLPWIGNTYPGRRGTYYGWE